MDFMARLAALVLRPRLKLTRFHGIFAPNFRHRQRIVPHHPEGRVDNDKPLAPIGQDEPVPRSTGMWESGDVLGSAPKTSICDRRRGLPGLRGATAGGRSCASCARGISASVHVIARLAALVPKPRVNLTGLPWRICAQQSRPRLGDIGEAGGKRQSQSLRGGARQNAGAKRACAIAAFQTSMGPLSRLGPSMPGRSRAIAN